MFKRSLQPFEENRKRHCCWDKPLLSLPKSEQVKDGPEKLIVAQTDKNLEHIKKKEVTNETYASGNDTRQLSIEQRKIVHFFRIKLGNLVVNARAGTGKSYVQATIARERAKRGEKTIMLMFSKDLKENSREDLSDIRSHVYVHSFHSVVQCVTGVQCRNDLEAEKFIDGITSAKNEFQFSDVTLLMLDEMQDATNLHIGIIRKIRRLISPNHRLIVCGDVFQNIFGSVGANVEYILRAAEIFNCKFETMSLTTCFRLTIANAEWINENLHPRCLQIFPNFWRIWGAKIMAMWGDGLKGNPDKIGVPVKQIIVDSMFDAPTPEIMSYLQVWAEEGHENMAILSPSVKDRSSPGQLIKRLNIHRSHNWNIRSGHVDSGNEACKKHKADLSTIHAFKGDEKDNILFWGFDYFVEEMAHKSSEKYPVMWPFFAFCLAYVALTRAKRELLVVSSCRQFFSQTNVASKIPLTNQISFYVRDLFDFVPTDKKINCLITETVVKDLHRGVLRPDFEMQGRSPLTKENMSALYGIAIENAMAQRIQQPTSPIDWPALIKEAGLTCISNYVTFHQLHDNWKNMLPLSYLNTVLYRALMLVEQFREDTFYHNDKCIAEITTSKGIVNLKGEFDFRFGGKKKDDVIIGGTIVELKCTQEHEIEHSMQVKLYEYVFKSKDVYVLNPILGLLTKVTASEDFVRAVVERKIN